MVLRRVKDTTRTEQVFCKDSRCDARGAREGERINWSGASGITRSHPFNIPRHTTSRCPPHRYCCVLSSLCSLVYSTHWRAFSWGAWSLLVSRPPPPVFSVLLKKWGAEVRSLATSSAWIDQHPRVTGSREGWSPARWGPRFGLWPRDFLYGLYCQSHTPLKKLFFCLLYLFNLLFFLHVWVHRTRWRLEVNAKILLYLLHWPTLEDVIELIYL